MTPMVVVRGPHQCAPDVTDCGMIRPYHNWPDPLRGKGFGPVVPVTKWHI